MPTKENVLTLTDDFITWFPPKIERGSNHQIAKSTNHQSRSQSIRTQKSLGVTKDPDTVNPVSLAP